MRVERKTLVSCPTLNGQLSLSKNYSRNSAPSSRCKRSRTFACAAVTSSLVSVRLRSRYVNLYASDFRAGPRLLSLPEKRSRPAEDTLRLLAEGRTFEEIARIRGRQLASVVGLVADLVEKGKLEFQSAWVESDKQQSIESACARLGIQWLKPLKEALPPEISFEEIRLIVARLRQQQLRASA